MHYSLEELKLLNSILFEEVLSLVANYDNIDKQKIFSLAGIKIIKLYFVTVTKFS